MKLREVIDMKTGINLSRQSEKKAIPLYTNEALLSDLNGMTEVPKELVKPDQILEFNQQTVEQGDVVFSFINTVASIVHEANSGKVINQNFAKISYDKKVLDSSYLCYLLNENKEVAKQKAAGMQGSVLKKLSPTIIRDLEVSLPSLDVQQKIGRLYLEWLKRQALAKQQMELENSLMLEIIDQLNKDKRGK